MQFRIIVVQEGHCVLVHSCLEGRCVSDLSRNLRQSRSPTCKGVGVLGRVGWGLAFGGHRYRTILHFCRSLCTITVHKGDGVLVLCRGVGCRIGGITRNIGNLRTPAAKFVSVFFGSGLCGCPRLYNISRGGTIGICSSVNDRAIIIHEGHGITVGGRRIGGGINDVSRHRGQSRSPARKGEGLTRSPLFDRVSGLCDVRGSRAVIVLCRSQQHRAVFVLEGYTVIVYSTVHYCSIGSFASDRNNFWSPAAKTVGVQDIVGGGLTRRSNWRLAVFYFLRSRGFIAIHEGNGVLVLGRCVGSDICGVARHHGNGRCPSLKRISKFSRSGLCRISGRHDVSGSCAVIVLCRGLQYRTVFVYESNRIFPFGCRVSCNVGDIVNHVHKLRRPSGKFIRVFRISSFRGICRLDNVCSQGSKIILFGVLENRSQVIIYKGHSIFFLSSLELGRIILILRNGDNFRIPTIKCVGVAGIGLLGGRCTGIYRHCPVGYRLRSQHGSVIQEPDGVVICHLAKDSLICRISCRSS